MILKNLWRLAKDMWALVLNVVCGLYLIVLLQKYKRKKGLLIVEVVASVDVRTLCVLARGMWTMLCMYCLY